MAILKKKKKKKRKKKKKKKKNIIKSVDLHAPKTTDAASVVVPCTPV